MMKKLTAFCAIILIGLYILLSVLGRQSQYEAEKILWKTNKRLSETVKNPESTPKAVYEEIAGQYEKIINRYDDYPSIKAQAELQLGNLYTAQENYEKARRSLQNVFVDFPGNDVLKAEAAMAIAITYEKEDNWPEAETVLHKIVADYPLTPVGLKVPLYLARKYLDRGDLEKADASFRRADTHYARLAEGHPDSAVGLNALNLLANSKILQEKWDDAVRILRKTMFAYPQSRSLLSTMQMLNTISIVKLRDPQRAQSVYREFLEEHPDHTLKKVIEQMDTGLRELKLKKERASSAEVNP